MLYDPPARAKLWQDFADGHAAAIAKWHAEPSRDRCSPGAIQRLQTAHREAQKQVAFWLAGGWRRQRQEA